jgi:hypothetical protein
VAVISWNDAQAAAGPKLEEGQMSEQSTPKIVRPFGRLGPKYEVTARGTMWYRATYAFLFIALAVDSFIEHRYPIFGLLLFIEFLVVIFLTMMTVRNGRELPEA